MSEASESGKPVANVSRRDFVRIAVGSLVTLPSVLGGFVVPPTLAYAEDTPPSEAYGGNAKDATTTITVVTASELGFCVADMADGGKTKVPGAKVVVTSRYNGKVVEDTTDDDGIVVLDIRELAENPDGRDVNQLGVYEFNGSITVTRDGYRTCEIALVRVIGAEGLLVPTRKLTDGLPYPRKTSFDEWDVLYTANDFASAQGNVERHRFDVVWDKLKSEETVVELMTVGSGTPLQSRRVMPQDGTLAVSFEDVFLKAGGSAALPVGAKYEVRLTQGEATYTAPIQLVVSKGLTSEPATKKDITLKPINTDKSSSTALDIKWPSGVPLVGGGSLKAWSPQLPVNIYLNPYGMLQITVTIPIGGYKKDNSGSDEQGWGRYPLKSASKQWDKLFKDAQTMGRKTSNAFSDNGNISQIDFAASFKLMAVFQVVAAAQWDRDKGIFQGMLGGQVFVTADFTLSENFFAGPIPVLITFSLNSSLIVSLNCGIYSLADKNNPNESLLDAAADFSRWHFDYTNTGLTVTFNITPSLSVGVGIRGVASICISGKFTLILFCGFTYRGPLDHDSHSLPHFIAGFSAQISLVLHMFLFTKTFALKDWKYRDFYDNWKGGLQSMADEAAGDLISAMAGQSLGDMLTEMNPITAGMLTETMESVGTTAMSGQAEDDGYADDATFDWETLRKDDVQAATDDGTLITYAVYQLAGDEPLVDPDEEGEAPDDPDETSEVSDSSDEAGDASVDSDEAGEQEALETQGETPDLVAAAAVPGEGDSEEPAVDGGATAEAAQDGESTGQPTNGAAEQPTDGAAEQGEPPKQPRIASRVVYEPSRSSSDLLSAMADGATLPDPGVTKLGAMGGVVPTSDKIIAKNVFGDPRTKVFNVSVRGANDTVRHYSTCSIRIGSVSVNGAMRTRLIVTVIDADEHTMANIGGVPQVVDFNMAGSDLPNRNDLFDYDFDVEVTAYTPNPNNPATIDLVNIVVVSGVRGEDPTLASAASDLVFSYLMFNANDFFLTRMGRPRRAIFKRANAVFGSADSHLHCISNLRCVGGQDNRGAGTLIISYLDRVSSNVGDVLADDSDRVDIKVRFLFVDITWREMKVPDAATVDGLIGRIDDASIFELDLSPNIGGCHTVTLRGYTQTHFYLVWVDIAKATITSVRQGAVLDSSIHLVPWEQQDCFLTSYPKASYVPKLAELRDKPGEWDRTQWVLQKAHWNTNTAAPNIATLSFEPIGPDHFNFSNFGINSSGTFLFWPQGRSGDDGRVFAEDGTAELDKDVPSYQIMACRIRQKGDAFVFCDPFIVADVPHDMSGMEIVMTRGRTCPLEVLACEPIKSEQQDKDGRPLYYASNLWYTSIPNLQSATATGCECLYPLVSPGGTVEFNVSVRNDGNTYLSGCTLQLCLHDGGKVTPVEDSTVALTFSKDTLLESNWNPKVDGELVGVEDDWSLAPGKCSLYRIRVAIPKDWGGDKQVSFVARKPVLAQGGGLTSMADDDGPIYQTYEAEPGEYKIHENRAMADQSVDRSYMDVVSVRSAVAEGDLHADAPVRVNDDDGDEPGGGGESGGGGKSNSGGSPSGNNGASGANGGAPGGNNGSRGNDGTRRGLAATGDDTSLAVPAALALGGAALVAYGRRVASNENDEARRGGQE